MARTKKTNGPASTPGTLYLVRWETNSFWWHAVGATQQEARTNLETMWAGWCTISGADPDLIVEWADGIQTVALSAGLMMRDWEPWTRVPAVPTQTYLTPVPVEGIDTDRIARALQAAHDAFWATMVEHFPEVASGDIDPGMTLDIEQRMAGWASAWLSYNHPDATDPFTH